MHSRLQAAPRSTDETCFSHAPRCENAQFKHRTVRKRYIALLEGRITPAKGRIELPLRPDLHDRPRQAVDPLHGKPAITEYEVLDVVVTQMYSALTVLAALAEKVALLLRIVMSPT